jgi:hypothetical protein
VEKEGFKITAEIDALNKCISMECPVGHQLSDLTPTSFRKGTRCKVCKIDEKIRKGMEELQSLVEKEGFKVKGVYINATTRILMECPFGHDMTKITAHLFKQGIRCAWCSPTSPERAREEFEKLVKETGYKIKGEYKGSVTHILMECPYGHIMKSTSPSKFKSGSRCPECDGRTREQAEANLRLVVEKENYTLLGEYVNCYSYILMLCPDGHLLEHMTPQHFKDGNRCARCNNVSLEQARENFEALAKTENYKILSPYITSDTHVLMECPKGHKMTQICPGNFKRGRRCARCQNVGYSQVAIQWLKWMEIKYRITIQHAENGGEMKINQCSVDGFCVATQTVFEYNGCYFHGCKTCYGTFAYNALFNCDHQILEAKTISREKKLMEAGYKVVSIWGHEWKADIKKIKIIQMFWRKKLKKRQQAARC